ncbi:hypothetical protein D3C73_1264260 [compost metagenome]
MAARRAHDDRRAGTDAGVDRVIGSDVAGMQGDHHVQLARRHTAHVTALEHQPRVIEFRCSGVAQVDHFLTQLDAGDLAFSLERIAQVIVNGERQIALARTEICHPHWFVQRQRRRGQGMAEHFDELVDLLPLA